LIYPGVVDDDTFDVSSGIWIQRGNSILYVSRFEKRKNHLALLRAFIRLRIANPTLRLKLVGFEIDGTLAAVMNFIALHKLDDHVDIAGNITDDQLKELYRTAGVVAYPSMCEGFGMPVIESFLLNPGTCYSNTTAMAEFSFAPEYKFSPEDDDAIVRTLEIGLRQSGVNPPDWDDQRRLVVQKYNWKQSAKVLAAMNHEGRELKSSPLGS
jgi:glycosyltransferase involved in cell wall biosynthesis